jgi:pimeloyl-ACP methyl ester carboxylesterase
MLTETQELISYGSDLDWIDYLVLIGCTLYLLVAIAGLSGALFWKIRGLFQVRSDITVDPSCKLMVILIHGTWSPAPAWTRAGSPFVKSVVDGLHGNFSDSEVQVANFSWDGRNTNAAREAATAKLITQILGIQNKNPFTKVILIGHSHGGNIAVSAAARVETSAPVKAVVTLATPFLVVSRRVLTSAFQTGVLISLSVFSSLIAQLILHSLGYNAAIEVLMLPFVLMHFIAISLELKAAKERNTICAKNQLLDIISKKTLIVRSADDEASSLLGSASLLVSVLFLFLQKLFYLMERLEIELNKFWSKRKTAQGLIYCIWMGSFVLGILCFKFGGSHPFINHTLAQSLTFIGLALTFAMPLIANGLVSAITGILIGVLLAVLMPIFAFVLTIFGWDIMRHGFHIRLSAEATPPGEWMVLLVKNEIATESPPSFLGKMGAVTDQYALHSRMSHSFVYENPNVLRALKKWASTINT